MSQEIELKLALPRKALPALRRHPIVQAAEKSSPTRMLDNTYYDTADLELRKRRIALRTRRQGRLLLQTVKCSAQSTGGLTSRPEWERPFAGSFDFGDVDATAVRKLLEASADELVPVFSTRFRRETREHRGEDDVRILMMIDTGEVVCGEHVAPICELELELVKGKPLDLLLLACQLAADLPLLPSDVSKAERGFRLHNGQQVQPLRAAASTITRDQSPVEAFIALASSCVQQWQANAVGAMENPNPEFIHQLRVSQRRLRSLLRLFAPALPETFVADWSGRLRDNANSFGDARDLDVLSDEILAPVAGTTAEEDAVLGRLQERVRIERDRARDAALARLDPAEQGRLIIGFMAALYAMPENTLHRSVDLRTFARLQLSRIRKRVKKRFEAARTLIPARLHALRIALKQLRYGIEFFTPLLHPREVVRCGKSLARAQNALGFINDLDVARHRLAAMAGDDVELTRAAAFSCGWHGPQYAKACRASIRELTPLLEEKTRWKKLTQG
jgi:adenylate cyclase